jgi:hypothetical protein
MNSAHFMRRTTPFIALASLVAATATATPSATPSATAAEPKGRWLFVDDGSGVEIAPCATAVDGLCGMLVQLPKSAAALSPAQRKQLCGVAMIGALKTATPKAGEQARLEGWVIDPEDLARTDRPKRYAASLVLTSEVSARLDVHGPFNIVLESHRLLRPVAAAAACE